MIDLRNDNEFTRLEAEFQSTRAAMVKYLRSKPATITETFSFTDGERSYTLSDFFGDNDDLIVIHNMGVACRHCTLWADGVNGLLPHLESRTSVVLVNEDPIETQKRIAAKRGWKFTMRRDDDGTFSRHMGFSDDDAHGMHHRMPGYSTFHRNSDGSITHVGSDTFGPGDIYMPVYPFFELLQDGAGDWEPDTPRTKPVTITIPESVNG